MLKKVILQGTIGIKEKYIFEEYTTASLEAIRTRAMAFNWLIISIE